MSGFRLVRNHDREPATALLLLEPRAESVLGARAHGAGARLHRVAGGVLLVFERALAEPLPGAIALRALAASPRILVPVDAELVPSLTPGEAAALAGEEGLVFLPGEPVLSFDPRRALAVTDLVVEDRVTRRAWSALPEPPVQASRLRSIEIEVPPEAPELILAAGVPPAPAEPRETDEAGAADRASLAIGRALFRAGEALDLDGLKKAGARWIDGLLSKKPSLGGDVLGQQEATLRDLLNKLRTGDIEEALRRALPLPEAGSGRGSKAAGDARLPVHDLAYSLRNVLGGATGPASVWFGGADVQRELAAEYLKAARKAAQDGDCRRAAFIYGKLLRDYRQAAHVLAQAGLHRDAAILYLTKCDDKLAAARSFAAAGEIDRAVALYREKGEHIQAGELLGANGDEEGAVQEYRTAALLLRQRQQWIAASEILLVRARRPGEAIACLEEGWARRESDGGVECGVRLLDLYAREERAHDLVPLVGAAESFLAVTGRDREAATFWNACARLPESASLDPALADDLRDRAKLGIALKLRQRADWDTKPARAVSELLGSNAAWGPAVHADARTAFGQALRKRRAVAREPLGRIRIAAGRVTAVTFAREAGLVFLGFENGEIHRFAAHDRSALRLSLHHPAVHALACDSTGKYLVAARGEAPRCELVSYSRRGEGLYFQVEVSDDETAGGYLLSNVSDFAQEPRFVAWNGERLLLYTCPRLRPLQELACGEDNPSALVIRPAPGAAPGALVFAGDRAKAAGIDVYLGFTPEVPRGVSVGVPPLAWLATDAATLEVVALSEAGVISWAMAREGVAHASVAHRAAGYLAATLLGPGLIAGVTGSAIEWLSVSSHEIERTGTTPLDARNAVACFHLETTRELAVVTADGAVVLAHVPGA